MSIDPKFFSNRLRFTAFMIFTMTTDCVIFLAWVIFAVINHWAADAAIQHGFYPFGALAFEYLSDIGTFLFALMYLVEDLKFIYKNLK